MVDRKSDLRVVRTRNALRGAFEELIAETTLDKITVKALTDRAGINRKTFYLHYETIEAFYDEIMNGIMDEFFAYYEKTPDDPWDMDGHARRFFRYLAAQPKQAPLKRRKLVGLCGAAAVLALVVALFNLFSKLDRVTQDYNNLRCSVDNVSNSVNSQINSITYRVENILKSQNSLTAEYSTELASTDLGANTATFDIRVVPKTYVDGMTALFVARSEEETVELPVAPGEDHAFSGEITCPLTDDISLTVVLVTGDKRETQWLEDYGYLYSGSFPDLSLNSQLWFDMVHRKDNLLPASQSPEIQVENYGEEGGYRPWAWRPEPPATVQVGLFQDQKLVMWYEEREEEININGVPTTVPAWFRPREVELDPNSVYSEVLLYTDAYGRQRVYGSEAIAYDAGEGRWSSSPVHDYGEDPADWKF